MGDISKLEKVRKALEEHIKITIVGTTEGGELPGRSREEDYGKSQSDYWQHINFFVAPNEGVYTAKELSVLLKSLVSTLEPTSESYFCEWGSVMDLGALYFTEEIGAVNIRYEVNLNEGVSTPKNLIDGNLVIEKVNTASRNTVVRLFPNIQFAKNALNGKNVGRINKMEIAKHRGFWHYLICILSTPLNMGPF